MDGVQFVYLNIWAVSGLSALHPEENPGPGLLAAPGTAHTTTGQGGGDACVRAPNFPEEEGSRTEQLGGEGWGSHGSLLHTWLSTCQLCGLGWR